MTQWCKHGGWQKSFVGFGFPLTFFLFQQYSIAEDATKLAIQTGQEVSMAAEHEPFPDFPSVKVQIYGKWRGKMS